MVNEKRSSNGEEKEPKLDAAHRYMGIHDMALDDQEFDIVIKNARRNGTASGIRHAV